MKLTEMNCVPPAAGTRPLGREAAAELAAQLEGWTLGEKELTKEYSFASFSEAVMFVNKVAVLAEGEGHHPDIYISYRKVRLTLSTHKIGGLSTNDFILAAKADEITAAAPAGR